MKIDTALYNNEKRHRLEGYFIVDMILSLSHQRTFGAFPNLICVCVSQSQIKKKRLARSKLPPKVKKLVANHKYL